MPEDDAESLLTPLVLVLASAAIMGLSGLVALAWNRRPRMADRVGAGVLAGGAAFGLAGTAIWLADRTPVAFARDWSLPWGRFFVVLDGLGAAFLLPLLLIPALAVVYGMGYLPQAAHGPAAARARVWLGTLAGSLALLPVARDGVLFLGAFEIMTLSAFLLIGTHDEQRDVRDAAWVYFGASHVSLMFLFAAFAIYRAATGTFDLTEAAAEGMGFGARTAVFLLVLVGFGLKAGMMPLHVWLPGAHANAPSHVSAILSGVVIKVGILGLAVFTAILPEPPMFWGLLVLLLGAASGVIGVAYAIGQHDLKRLLAYHSIENIGIILMGLGVAMLGRWGGRPDLVVLGMACAIMHVWNHGLFKALLFLSAGSVIHSVKTRQIEEMGGLARPMPWTAGLFTLGAVAICGLPPLNGFVSEFFLYMGSLRSLLDGSGVPTRDAPRVGSPAGVVCVAAPVLALIGALASACFIKVIGCVFLGHPRSEAAADARECPGIMRAPMGILAALCVVLGLVPVIGAPVLDAAAASWAGQGPSHGSGQGPGPGPPASLPSLASLIPFGTLSLVVASLGAAMLAAAIAMAARRRERRDRRAVTWDCGYAAPSPRMQYSASSVARTLVHLFAFALRPREHAPTVAGPFPRPQTYHGHVDDATLEGVVRPFCRAVAARFVRIRQWQTGRIQAYIVYVGLTTLCMLLFVLPLIQLLRRLVTQ